MSRGLISIAVAGLALAALGAGAAQAQDVAHGQSLFQDRCSMCHVLGQIGQGPDLVGVVGRKAGSLSGFNYTPALSGSGLVWTQANLQRFLTDPRAMVPGTAMRVKLNTPADRQDLVAYLATLKRH